MDKQMISSAGMLFLYLAGEVSEDGAIGIHWTDSYQRPLDFYERVRELRAEISDKVDLEIFCVLGVSEKVDGIEAFVEGQIKERVLEICGEPGREGKGTCCFPEAAAWIWRASRCIVSGEGQIRRMTDTCGLKRRWPCGGMLRNRFYLENR